MKISRRRTVILMQENRIGIWGFILFFLILCVSLVLNSFLLLNQSIRLDEAQSIFASTKPILAILSYISHDVTTPLYAILLHFWIQFFGASITAARILSFIFFLATLIPLFMMAKEASTKRVALLTIILFSLSPFIVWYALEARMYTLFTFITCVNYVYFLKLLRSRGEEGSAGYTISAILGLYTHYFFILALLIQGIYVMTDWIITLHKNNRHTDQSLSIKLHRQGNFPLHLIKLMVLSGIFFLPWIGYVSYHGGITNTQPLIPPPTSFNILQTFVNFIFGFQTSGIQTVLISLWPLAIVFLLFAFTQKRKIHIQNIDYILLATFLPILIVFVLSFFRPIFLSRYLILVTPTLFLTISWLLINSSKRISLFLTGSVITIMFGLLMYQNISEETPVKENYEGVSKYLEENARADDIIAVSAPFTIYPIEYTYQGRSRIDTIPYWDIYAQGAIPHFSTQSLQRQLTRYKNQYSNIYIVLSYNQGYEDKIKKFMDTHYKRLTLKKFSPGLTLAKYQLRY